MADKQELPQAQDAAETHVGLDNSGKAAEKNGPEVTDATGKVRQRIAQVPGKRPQGANSRPQKGSDDDGLFCLCCGDTDCDSDGDADCD